MCLAEDSGLEVAALGGTPGIYSARYSKVKDMSNMEYLLQQMLQLKQRDARFVTVIALLEKGDKLLHFEGVCEGSISYLPKGNNGFGYDPIFIPNGYDQTFGELPPHIKNAISHRKKAVQSMVAYLTQSF